MEAEITCEKEGGRSLYWVMKKERESKQEIWPSEEDYGCSNEWKASRIEKRRTEKGTSRAEEGERSTEVKKEEGKWWEDYMSTPISREERWRQMENTDEFFPLFTYSKGLFWMERGKERTELMHSVQSCWCFDRANSSWDWPFYSKFVPPYLIGEDKGKRRSLKVRRGRSQRDTNNMRIETWAKSVKCLLEVQGKER